MLERIVQFVVGALLAGGGGYLAWTQRAGAMNVFPPGAAGMPWLMIMGLLALAGAVTLLVSAVHPRPNRKARLAAQAADRDAVLNAADTYYAERSRAADRDWRSGDISAPATPAPAPAPETLREPVREPMRETVRVAPPPAPPPVAARPLAPPPPPPVEAKPVPPPEAPAPAPAAAAKPVATSAPPAAPDATPFPSTATLAPIPRAAEPPPLPAASPAPQPAPLASTAAPAAPAAPEGALFADIRAAIAQGRLEEADRMLNAERERVQGLALAELTGLAGDHAAAAGRASHAKWLWRRALSRFGELNAMDAPAARAVAEKLRTAE